MDRINGIIAPQPLNQRVPGSSPGAPTTSTENTGTYEDRPGCYLRDQPSGHTGVTDRQETHTIPYAIVEQRVKFVKRTNSHKLILRYDIWNAPGVSDVTQKLSDAARNLEARREGA
jgi:hypothetical protein